MGGEANKGKVGMRRSKKEREKRTNYERESGNKENNMRRIEGRDVR